MTELSWTTATTLADLGELTARWLEGTEDHPGNFGPPDEETRELIPVLARLNRSGFITTGSQPGYLGPDGRQLAAVSGLTADPSWSGLTAGALVALGADAGVRVIIHAAAPSWWRQWRLAPGVMATWAASGRELCDFGGQLRAGDVRRFLAPGLKRTVQRDACDALQLTVVDTEPGRNTMWAALAAVSQR
jgi:hypothetical protein